MTGYLQKTIKISPLILFLLVANWSTTTRANDWGKISGPVTSVHVGYYPGQDTVRILANKAADGDLYEFHVDSKKWTRIGGPGKMFAVDNVGRIYGLSLDGKMVHCYQGKPMQWKKIGGAAESIVGTHDGVVATNPDTGDLYEFRFSTSKWTKIGGPAKMLVSNGKGRLLTLSPDNVPAEKAGVYLYTGSPMKWEKIGGPSGTIYAGHNTFYATNPQTGDIYQYDDGSNKWSKVGGAGKMFAAGDGSLFGLAPDGNSVSILESPMQWKKIGGPAASIHAVGGELLGIDPETQDLYRYAGKAQVQVADFIVIVPNEEIGKATNDFIAWKKSIGHSITAVNLQAIEKYYPGRDTAERIRNYLIDKNNKHNIHYVLLVGDIDQLPTRILYGGKGTMLQHRAYAADFYFANLSTTNWDPDGDQMWGEFEDDQFTDMAKHDVVVSRIPFNDANQIRTVLHNVIDFEKDNGAWKRRALLACGFCDPSTDGAILGEQIDNDILKYAGWSSRKFYFRKENTTSSYLGQPNTLLLNSKNLQAEIAPQAQGLITLSGHGNPTGLASYYTTSTGNDGTEYFHSTADIHSDFCSAVVFVSGCSTGPPIGGSGPHPGVPNKKSLWTAGSNDTRAEHFGKNYLSGGAVAVITASAGGDYGSGWAGPNDGMCQSLTYYFHANFVQKKQPVGDAFFNAMDKYVDNHGLTRGVRVFYLVGDPSVSIN